MAIPPPFRTASQRETIWRPAVAGLLFVVFGVPLASLVLAAVLILLNALPGTGEWFGRLMAVPLLGAYSIFYSTPVAVAALPLAMLALRTGWAGWATAILAGTCVTGGLMLILADAVPPFLVAGTLIGGLFGFFYWCGAWLFSPRTDAWRGRHPQS